MSASKVSVEIGAGVDAAPSSNPSKRSNSSLLVTTGSSRVGSSSIQNAWIHLGQGEQHVGHDMRLSHLAIEKERMLGRLRPRAAKHGQPQSQFRASFVISEGWLYRYV